MSEYVWKIIHNPTGLFFSQSGYKQGKKSNLSESGKIYAHNPSLAYVKYAKDKDGKKLSVADFSIHKYELSLVSIASDYNKKTNIPKPEFPHDLS